MPSASIPVAFSPCPNDTFAFDAWVEKKIPSSIAINPVLADIQQLNEWAYAAKFPVTKVSTYCLGNITSKYVMLPVGAAIQTGGGPKLIAKTSFASSEIKDKTVAVPGLDTTAYLLLRTLLPEPKKIVSARYEEIPELVKNGSVDAGVIIHETRFIFSRYGLVEIADLGTLFTDRCKSPLPLGVIVAQRSLGEEYIQEISTTLMRSVKYAQAHKEITPFILASSQEKDLGVIHKHIDMYVTQETEKISARGVQALYVLFTHAINQKLLPKEALNFL